MISVLIASMGRPFLAKTLASIAAARVPAGEELAVIIADDSPDGAVGRLLSTIESPLAITVVPVAAGNVSLARNACLDAAKGEWLIFVDDDEIVEPDWIEGHLSAARDFRADAVFGPVFPVYPEGTPEWFRTANPLFQDWGWNDDGRESWRGRTGNTLMRHAVIGNLRFDPEFGRTGGEDHDFFLRFAAAGHRMVVTNRARAHEDVPAARANAGYALGRAVRGGQIYARRHLQAKGRMAVLAFMVDASVKFVVASGLSLALRPLKRARAFSWAMRAALNRGKLQGAAGAPTLLAWAN